MKDFMKISMKIIILALTFLIAGAASGQDTLSYQNIYPAGISIEYGIGNYSVKDEYISKEKYSGILPVISFGWARRHTTYVYRLDLTYRNSDNINNYTVSTDITQFTLNQGFLYPLKKKVIFKKDLYIWLGPSTEFFFFANNQNIAVTGFDYAQSYAALFSLGFQAECIFPLKRNFQLESSLRLTVLSLGYRMVDSEEDDQSPVNLLTMFSGLNSSFDLGVRYCLLNRFSAKLAYQLEVTRISAWDPLLSASDNLVLTLTYRF
jgi:hypothetical protein